MAARFKSILIIVAFMNLLVFPFYVSALLPVDPYKSTLTVKENNGIVSCISFMIMAEENNEEKDDIPEDEDGFSFLIPAFDFTYNHLHLSALIHTLAHPPLLNNQQTIYCPPECGDLA